eukprot:292219-Amphidinium_carterae.4
MEECYYGEGNDLHAEMNDEGEDSDCDDVFWMHPDSLAQPWEEHALDQAFATFAEVKRQKAAIRTNRGYYGGKNKGKGKKGSKGKGKDKGKDFGKSEGDSGSRTSQLQNRWQRDQRRQ